MSAFKASRDLVAFLWHQVKAGLWRSPKSLAAVRKAPPPDWTQQRPLAATRGPASSQYFPPRVQGIMSASLRDQGKLRSRPQRFESGLDAETRHHTVLCDHTEPRTQRHSSHPVFQHGLCGEAKIFFYVWLPFPPMPRKLTEHLAGLHVWCV